MSVLTSLAQIQEEVERRHPGKRIIRTVTPVLTYFYAVEPGMPPEARPARPVAIARRQGLSWALES